MGVEDGGDDGHQEHRAGADQAAEIEKPQMKTGNRGVGTEPQGGVGQREEDAEFRGPESRETALPGQDAVFAR